MAKFEDFLKDVRGARDHSGATVAAGSKGSFSGDLNKESEAQSVDKARKSSRSSGEEIEQSEGTTTPTKGTGRPNAPVSNALSNAGALADRAITFVPGVSALMGLGNKIGGALGLPTFSFSSMGSALGGGVDKLSSIADSVTGFLFGKPGKRNVFGQALGLGVKDTVFEKLGLGENTSESIRQTASEGREIPEIGETVSEAPNRAEARTAGELAVIPATAAPTKGQSTGAAMAATERRGALPSAVSEGETGNAFASATPTPGREIVFSAPTAGTARPATAGPQINEAGGVAANQTSGARAIPSTAMSTPQVTEAQASTAQAGSAPTSSMAAVSLASIAAATAGARQVTTPQTASAPSRGASGAVRPTATKTENTPEFKAAERGANRPESAATPINTAKEVAEAVKNVSSATMVSQRDIEQKALEAGKRNRLEGELNLKVDGIPAGEVTLEGRWDN